MQAVKIFSMVEKASGLSYVVPARNLGILQEAAQAFGAVTGENLRVVVPKDHHVPGSSMLRVELRGNSDTWPAVTRALQDAEKAAQDSILDYNSLELAAVVRRASIQQSVTVFKSSGRS